MDSPSRVICANGKCCLARTIVAITAGVTPEDRQKCFDAGMDDFVMKPFKISTLKDVILKYVRKKKE